MTLHVPTLLIVLFGMCLLSSIGMGTRWLRSRGEKHHLYWCVTLALAAAALAGLALRDIVPDWLSIVAANALVLATFGIGWNGFRVFDHRKPRWLVALILPAIWLAACMVPEIYGSFAYRVAVASFLVATACFVLSHEIWFRGPDRLPSRGPLAALCFLHGVISAVRMVFALSHGPSDTIHLTDFLSGLALLEPIFILYGVTLLGLGMTQQRTERRLLRQASVDGLTGLLNRTAFMDYAANQLDEIRGSETSLTFLMFDLDRFKEINDQYGHPTGDKVLVAFADLVRQVLRDTDPVGRIGGEEFAALLTGVDAEAGSDIAERIRSGFARRLIEHEGGRIKATVSIGLISASGMAADLASLMAQADKALYAAKRGGRDLVHQATARA